MTHESHPIVDLEACCYRRGIKVHEALGITRQAVSRWSKTYIPEDRALDIEDLTEGVVPIRLILSHARYVRRLRERVKAAKLADFQRRLKGTK